MKPAAETQGAVLLPFPIVRRGSLVKATAAQMLSRPPTTAEKYLQMQIRRQAAAMRRKQLTEEQINNEVRQFEAAVRATLWRRVLTPDGAA